MVPIAETDFISGSGPNIVPPGKRMNLVKLVFGLLVTKWKTIGKWFVFSYYFPRFEAH